VLGKILLSFEPLLTVDTGVKLSRSVSNDVLFKISALTKPFATLFTCKQSFVCCVNSIHVVKKTAFIIVLFLAVTTRKQITLFFTV